MQHIHTFTHIFAEGQVKHYVKCMNCGALPIAGACYRAKANDALGRFLFDYHIDYTFNINLVTMSHDYWHVTYWSHIFLCQKCESDLTEGEKHKLDLVEFKSIKGVYKSIQ